MKTGSGGRVFFLVLNANHVEIFRDAAAELGRRGEDVRFLVLKDHAGTPRARAALKALDTEPVFAGRVIAREAGAGDLIVSAMPKGLKREGVVDDLRARGVRLAQVVEGARFQRPYKYLPGVPLLGWGPSARGCGVEDVRIVGSPVIEAAMRAGNRPDGSRLAIVNYKFTDAESASGLHRTWAAATDAACRSLDFTPVFSVHPVLQNLPSTFTAASEPASALLQRARLLVTRSSTLLFEALVAGVQPFFFPLEGEETREFTDPMGAYPVAGSGEELARQIADWEAGRTSFHRGTFLAAHVDIDPERPAWLRMADALLGIRNGD